MTPKPQPAPEKEPYLAAIRAALDSGAPSSWLARRRATAAARFEALSFPSTRDEEWKYTNVAPLLKTPLAPAIASIVTTEEIARFTFDESRQSQLIFVNGRFAPAHSDLSALPAGIVAGSIAELVDGETGAAAALRAHFATIADDREAAFTALNTALAPDGALVYVPAGTAVEPPISLLFVTTATQTPLSAQPRTLIILERGASATVLESYVSPAEDVYFNNAVTEVVLEAGASLDHYRLQEESERAWHIATTVVKQARDSRYASVAISLGALLGRHTLEVALTGEGIASAIDGLYVTTGRQHLDNHTTIDHQQPHAQSRQLYKGILDDQSRAVFNGKVFVREGALLTDARQLNKNLLLSPEAHVDTKPQLEIYADDVKCSHGATVGQLEEEEIFYLASRGLSPERARALLTYGFAEDVISKIRYASVREHLDGIVLDKLHQSLEVS